jgi:YesN/AraC family two-component response regulator
MKNNTAVPDEIHTNLVQRPIRIIIADDSQRTRNGLQALLSTAHITGIAESAENGASDPALRKPSVVVVGVAVNGEEALLLTEDHCPDAILMDIRMPVMDGLEATQAIKSRWPDVRVIVLTTHPEYQSQALTAGADKFLLKGCPTDDLLEALYEGTPPARTTEENERC